MRHLICSLLIGISLSTFAQNGGQFPENNSVKLEYIGGGQVKVTNKQSCSSVITLNDSKTVGDITIAGNSSFIYILPPDLLTNIRVKAKNNTNCGNSDYGFVELFLSSLPVTFASFTTQKQNGTTVLVNFKSENPVNAGKYRIMVSQDGKTWLMKDEIKHIDNVSNYSTSINLSTKKQ